ncbi:MAG: hypothetical protein ACF8XB_12070 [Planctomycetota bacterium JB042]
MAESHCRECGCSLGAENDGTPPDEAGDSLCAGCRERPHGQDRRPPLVLAFDSYHDGWFHFRCPKRHCRRPLRVRQVVPDEILVCPRRRCRAEMRLITREQRAALRRQRREREEESRRLLESHGASVPDQIAVLGRPQSGKTVYLSVLYQNLWRGAGDLRACSTDGESHRTLLEQYASMTRGEWPEGGQGTLDVRRLDWSIEYRDAMLHLSTMDYPGEVYRKVFFEKRLDQPECVTLFRQVESAMAVMLLLDPMQALADELDIVDLEYSCVQVVEHLRTKGLARNFVVVLTKRDQNAALLAQHGGPRAFLRQRLPRLATAVPEVPVLSLCAMPEARDAHGVVRRNAEQQTIPQPLPGGEPQVLVPLRRLLEGIDPDHLDFLSGPDRR